MLPNNNGHDFRYTLPNLQFVKLDVGRYPKEGERFRINTHVLSKQLPSISVIRHGKQVNRRPTIGSNQRAIPFKFTEARVSCCLLNQCSSVAGKLHSRVSVE